MSLSLFRSHALLTPLTHALQEKNSPEGLVGANRRFVKFGGGTSPAQLAWLRAELGAAAERGERAIVCSHLARAHDGWNLHRLLRLWPALPRVGL